jgi:CheY-like chemotaxis protein
MMRLAWQQCREPSVNITEIRDTKEALKIVMGEGAYASTPKPHLITLDYNMPRGAEAFLSALKSQEAYQHIPVIVITGSQSPQVLLDAYRRHANCCFHKPVDLDSLIALVCDIAQHWLKRAIVPGTLGPR